MKPRTHFTASMVVQAWAGDYSKFVLKSRRVTPPRRACSKRRLKPGRSQDRVSADAEQVDCKRCLRILSLEVEDQLSSTRPGTKLHLLYDKEMVDDVPLARCGKTVPLPSQRTLDINIVTCLSCLRMQNMGP